MVHHATRSNTGFSQTPTRTNFKNGNPHIFYLKNRRTYEKAIPPYLYIHDGGGRCDVGGDALRRGNRRLGAAQLRREFVCILQNLRKCRADGTIERAPAAADAADDLPGVHPIAAVDVDEIIQLVKDFVAEFSAFVVVHRADEDHQLFDGW